MSSLIILSIVLTFSLLFNGLIFWYNRQILSRLNFIYQNINDVSELIANYRVHLRSVYQMEMFYGDETLQFLMNHTRSLNNLLEEYEDSEFFLEEYEGGEEQNNIEEKLDAPQTKIDEENVFYAGSRRRDS